MSQISNTIFNTRQNNKNYFLFNLPALPTKVQTLELKKTSVYEIFLTPVTYAIKISVIVVQQQKHIVSI